jgi:hypothetical protein
MVITAVNTNPELMADDRRTIFKACSKAAHGGLMPDGNEAALVFSRLRLVRQCDRDLPTPRTGLI